MECVKRVVHWQNPIASRLTVPLHECQSPTHTLCRIRNEITKRVAFSWSSNHFWANTRLNNIQISSHWHSPRQTAARTNCFCSRNQFGSVKRRWAIHTFIAWCIGAVTFPPFYHVDRAIINPFCHQLGKRCSTWISEWMLGFGLAWRRQRIIPQVHILLRRI